MESFERVVKGDVLILNINLINATMAEVPELRQIIDEHILYGQRKMIVDLSECSHIDSTFIGALVVSLRKISSMNGEIKLVEPVSNTKELFHVTGVSKVFSLHTSVNDAIEEFNNEVEREPALTSCV